MNEQKLAELAKEFPYPPTPIIKVNKERQQQTIIYGLMRAAALLILVLAALFAIPQTRAAILEFLQIGAVRIDFIDEAEGVDAPSSQTLQTLELIFGEVTLQEAQGQVNFDLRYPQDYGLPDRVYAQPAFGETVVMVWITDDGKEIELVLYQIGSQGLAKKRLTEIESTFVDGNEAYWAAGPHLLLFKSTFDLEDAMFVMGNVLIWEDDPVTYRLETGQSLEDAVEIAELLVNLER